MTDDPRGWHWPFRSRRYHYFLNQRSLCRRFTVKRTERLDDERPEIDICGECDRLRPNAIARRRNRERLAKGKAK